MRGAPKGLRLHIGLFGRRNVGKSSLLNAITRQQVSIVSEQAGTTTDPVEKPMELQPLGPVLFIDTAGVDDEGDLGEMRVLRTGRALDRTELGILVAEAGRFDYFERRLLDDMLSREIPVIVVFNKMDQARPETALLDDLAGQGVAVVQTVATGGIGIPDLRRAILQVAPADFVNRRTILADLVGPGQMAVLVVPIDKEAPQGRLILPQVQAIRELLDHRSFCVVVQDDQLCHVLDRLKSKPRLVVTDSQAFERVAAQTPRDVPLTSFSILFARFKGDLAGQVRGTLAISELRPGDHVLVAEACTHHPITDDIGRVKIPRWLNQHVGGRLRFRFVQGHDFPEDLSPYRLVIHCGACMLNRREVLTRLERCRGAGVPASNYGLAIAYSLGILERSLEPFQEARHLARTAPRSAAGGR